MPDPSKNLQDLFQQYNGNVEVATPSFCWFALSFFLNIYIKYNLNVIVIFTYRRLLLQSWVHISKELKEAFDPDYPESYCVVYEPDHILENKSANESMEQP